MFDAEVDQAAVELRRPWLALLASGITAGAGVGTTVLLLALLVTQHAGVPEGFLLRLLVGSAYAVGFIIAILARGDLFTEYTTIAILPVLTGDSHLRKLARLWALIYAGNLIGGWVFAGFVVVVGPALGVIDQTAFVLLGEHLVGHAWWVVLLSATLAGWLMGVLSWLIAGGRDTTSQILLIWLVGMVIGGLGLHHAITGAVEVFAGMLAGPTVGWPHAAHFLVWTTLGNAVGGIIFAMLVRQGVRLHPEQQTDVKRHGRKSTGRRR